MSKVLKKLLGILIFLLFIYLLVVPTGVLSDLNSSITQLWSKIPFIRGIDKPSYVVTKEVVQEESNTINVVKNVSPSVVSIVVKTVNFNPFSGPVSSDQGIGTGFIVESSGLIVTNNHVVDDASDQYSVVLNDGTIYDVNKIYQDAPSDIALIQITARDLPVVQLGDSSNVQVGQIAIAIGNALGQFSNTVTKGVISGVARELTASGPGGQASTYEGALQTDAALNPGNSGGPLLNSAGQVIGINVATTLGANNISFAIPVNTLKPILDNFLKTGRIIRPFMGVEYSVITKDMAQLRDLPQGAFLTNIVRDSPAQKSGLQRGDIITEYNSQAIDDSNTLSSLVSQSNVGDKVTLTVDRAGKVLTVQITLGEAPQATQTVPGSSGEQ